MADRMKCFTIKHLSIMPLLLWACAASAGPPPRVHFAVSPAQPLMDDRISIIVTGLPPNQLITFKARSQAQDQLWWRSEAVFNSGPAGTIDLAHQPSLSGTYTGVAGMGLFWSMKPDPDASTGDRVFFAMSDWFQPIVTEIEADSAGQPLGSVVIERRFAAPGTRCTAIAEAGITGLLCAPGDSHPHPAVLVLGGSEGGIGMEDTALLLASHGFTALSLAYFGVPGLPPTLQNVPIDHFAKALQWLRARPETDPAFVAVFGVSRGAEAALQFAATDPAVAAVVARSPSFVRWEGATANQLPGGPAWTCRGKPLPYVPFRIPLSFAAQYLWGMVTGEPIRQTPLFLHSLAVFGDTASAEIPVENIHGPVLLLSGKDDGIWPSAMMANRILDRLRRNNHPYADQHLSYDAVGHWIPCEFLPTAGDRQKMKLVLGGTAEGTAAAQADSWPRILWFLTQASVEKKTRP